MLRKLLPLFIVTIFIFGCTSRNMQQYSQPAFDLQGHRGCRGLFPENTIAGFLNALELGVNTLEMDAVITADKKVILSHEPFFNHEISLKPDGSFIRVEEEKQFNIYKMTFAETQGFDVGMKFHPQFPQQRKVAAHKPLLAELIDSVKLYCRKHRRPLPQFNIETKTDPATDSLYHPAPEVFVDLLMNVIKEKQLESNVIIQSFDFRTLQYLHNKYASIKTAALIEGESKVPLREIVSKLGFTPTIYSPEAVLVNNELVESCQARGIQLIPWTIK